MALTRASQEAIWLQQLLEHWATNGPNQPTCMETIINQGSIALAKNPGDHPRSNHIQFRYHYIHFNLSEGTMDLSYIPMPADGMTKPLTRLKSLDLMGMKHRPSGSVRNWKELDGLHYRVFRCRAPAHLRNLESLKHAC